MKTIIGEYTKQDTIYASESKDEIDKIQAIIQSRINSGRMRVTDNEKLTALRKRIIWELKHPFRAWLKNILTGK